MPHVIVKLYAGRTELQKSVLAEAIARTLIETLGAKDASISVGIEDVAPDDWTRLVYDPDITAKPLTIFKKPGY